MTPLQEQIYARHKDFIDGWIRQRVPHLSRQDALDKAFAKLHLPMEPYTGRTSSQRERDNRLDTAVDTTLKQREEMRSEREREAETQAARELREAREYLADLESRYASTAYNPTQKAETANLERRMDRIRSAIRTGEERVAAEQATKADAATLTEDPSYAFARTLCDSDGTDELLKSDEGLALEWRVAQVALLAATPENAKGRAEEYKVFSKKLVDRHTLAALAKSQAADDAAMKAVNEATAAKAEVTEQNIKAATIRTS